MLSTLTSASLPQLLAEISRRFAALPQIPEWAAPVVEEVAGYYELEPTQLRSGEKLAYLTKPRHLAIALLSGLHPSRTRSEVTAVLGLKYHMHRHALEKIETRVAQCPTFQTEVATILKRVREREADMATAAPRRRVPALATEIPS